MEHGTHGFLFLALSFDNQKVVTELDEVIFMKNELIFPDEYHPR